MGFYKMDHKKWKQLPNKGETDQKMFMVFAKTGKDQNYWEFLQKYREILQKYWEISRNIMNKE